MLGLDKKIYIQTESFDGPLSLLLHLIKKKEMSIHDLDLVELTKEYLDFLEKMEDLDFDLAGEYLYLAASLIFIKSLESLGNDNEENTQETEDDVQQFLTKEELFQRLKFLEIFQELGQKIYELPRKDEVYFTRMKNESRKDIQSMLYQTEDSSELTNAMLSVLTRERRKIKIVKNDRISIKDRVRMLKDILTKGSEHRYRDLLKDGDEVPNRVVTFISILELARLQYLNISQSGNYTDINIKIGHRNNIENLNMEDVDGY